MALTINSPKWNEPLGKVEIKQAVQDYGKLAEDFKELTAFIKEADKLFNKAETDALSNFEDVAIKTGHPHPLESDKSYDLAQTQKTYKTALRILYSFCRLKPDIKRIIGTEAAETFYINSLENCLRFINKGQDTSCMSGPCLIKIPAVIPNKSKKNKGKRVNNGEWRFAGNSQVNDKKLIDKIVTNLLSWQESLNLDGIKNNLRVRPTEYSFPLPMSKWADILKVSENTLRILRKQNKYHFNKVSERKWRLPEFEIPIEYLEKYRQFAKT